MVHLIFWSFNKFKYLCLYFRYFCLCPCLISSCCSNIGHDHIFTVPSLELDDKKGKIG